MLVRDFRLYLLENFAAQQVRVDRDRLVEPLCFAGPAVLDETEVEVTPLVM